MRETVYNIFRDFFEDENVDLRDSYIIIHFPVVTITNENDMSHEITGLWVRVNVSSEGTILGTFQMIRSEFTISEITVGYVHSHVPYTSLHNIQEWRNPCLGNGPIRSTITSLAREYNEEMWKLFCLELSKYVATESLNGGPYTRMENIYNNRYSTTFISPKIEYDYNSCNHSSDSVINEFISYILLKRPFKFNYYNGSYGIAMPFRELYITLSNLFIEWYNFLPKEKRLPKQDIIGTILLESIIVDDKLAFINNINRLDVENYEDLVILTFKGKDIHLKINQAKTSIDENKILLLSTKYLSIIINKILTIVNLKYGHEELTSNRETFRFF